MWSEKPEKGVLPLAESLCESCGFAYGISYVIIALVAHNPVAVDKLVLPIFFFVLLDFFLGKKLKNKYLEGGNFGCMLVGVSVLAGIVIALV